ncbi:hypothetical protein SLS60_007439 [Paraconiothyrium brasiliense]|uniref:Uncharacterized protein n=1 Tax=Paraconiothyrium brasiliense TaxID=300254 RepID=A0ABR3R5D0_9PLEO
MTLESPYHQWIKSLVAAGYGNLRVLERGLMHNSEHVDATCTVLTLTKDGTLEENRPANDVDFAPLSKHKSNRAFVIEGLSKDMVEKAGSAFDIEPEFFGSHLRATAWEYYDVALVNRFVSYWERDIGEGYFNRVILIDSPLPEYIEFAYDDSEGSQVLSEAWDPYQGGPLDFANLATRKAFLKKHPKVPNGYQESVKEMLISRLNSPALVLPEPDGTSTTAAILQRIVLSNWALTLRFLRRDFDSVNLGDLTNESITTPSSSRMSSSNRDKSDTKPNQPSNKTNQSSKPPKTPTTKDITNREYFSADGTHEHTDDFEDFDTEQPSTPKTSPKHVRSNSAASLVNISNTKEETPSPTASEILLNADIRDVAALSEFNLRAREEGKSSEERKRLLVEMQEERVMKREGVNK